MSKNKNKLADVVYILKVTSNNDIILEDEKKSIPLGSQKTEKA